MRGRRHCQPVSTVQLLYCAGKRTEPCGMPPTLVVVLVSDCVSITVTDMAWLLFTKTNAPSGVIWRSVAPGPAGTVWIKLYVDASMTWTEPPPLETKTRVPVGLKTTLKGSVSLNCLTSVPVRMSTTSKTLSNGYVTQASVPSGLIKTDSGYSVSNGIFFLTCRLAMSTTAR